MARKPIAPEVTFARDRVGAYGFVVIADTAAHTPVSASPLATADVAFVAIAFTADSVLSALTSSSAAKSPITGDVTTLTLPAGFVLLGNFASVTLASGAAVAYVGPSIA